MSIPTIRVYGQFIDAAGDPMSGNLSWRLNHKLVDSVGNVVSERTEIVSVLDDDGKITDTDGTTDGLVLYCTSGDDITPEGLVYDVVVNVGSRPHKLRIALPDTLGATVNFADLVPVPATTGVVWTVPDLTAEQVYDAVGSTIVAGAGLSKTVDDAGNTVTLVAEVTQAELDAEATARAAADTAEATARASADTTLQTNITAEATARAAAIAALSGTYQPLDAELTTLAGGGATASSLVRSLADDQYAAAAVASLGLRFWAAADHLTPPDYEIDAATPDAFTGLKAWFKADAITGLTDGQAVSSWTDSGPNGWHATQATGSKQPVYRSDGGVASVEFDGTNDILTLPAGSLGMLRNVAGATIIAVAKVDSLASPGSGGDERAIFQVSTNASLDYYRAGLFWNSTGDGRVGVPGRPTDSNIPFWTASNTESVLNTSDYFVMTGAIDYAAGVIRGRLSGQRIIHTTGLTTPQNTPDTDSLTINIGGLASDNEFFDGKIAEVIVFNRRLALREIAAIEKYLAAKYSTPFTLVPDADTEKVAVLPDLSGGEDAAQSVQSRRPTLLTSGINGRPALVFPGSSSVHMALDTLSLLEPPFSAFVVFRTGASLAGGIFGNRQPSGTGTGISLLVSSSKFAAQAGNGGGSGLTVTAGSTLTTETAYIGSLVAADLTGFTGYLNGVQDFQRTTPNWASSTAVAKVGTMSTGFDEFVGRIAEIIVFDSALTATARKRVERYLARKYGITAPAASASDLTSGVSADTVLDGVTNKAFTAAEKTKLAGIEAAAIAQRTLFARKTATEAVTASTTLQDDDALTLALLANSTYVFDALVLYDAPTAADIKVALTVPAGATLSWTSMRATSGISATPYPTNTEVTAASGTAVPSGAAGVGTTLPFRARGIVVTGGTAGNLTVQWAQNASDPTAASVFANSFITAQRVA